MILSMTMLLALSLANGQPTVLASHLQTQMQAFYGVCDASAVVALNHDLFVLGDDENNALSVYSWKAGGHPIARVDTSLFLGVNNKQPEVDIEGAARIGDRIFWISSHGRNADGKKRLSRHRLFGSRISFKNDQPVMELIGKPYTRLLTDLHKDPRLAPYRLKYASLYAPKEPGALNIEGLSATPDGRLLIGFRNPIPRGKALLVPLLNPESVIMGRQALLGNPILLYLGGRGIRSITFWRGKYYIIAGSYSEGGISTLFLWNGGSDQPVEKPLPIFNECNPEAIDWLESSEYPRLLMTSDDGMVEVDGIECKRLHDASKKIFRAYAIPLPP